MKVPTPKKLPSGSWYIQLRLGGESIPITRPTEKECIKAAQFVKAEYLSGKREKKSKLPTLGEAIDTYIASKTNVLSPSTIRGYETIRRCRFQDHMDTPISDISDSKWITICNEEAAICSPKTLQNSWRFIATVLRQNGLNPPKITLPQVPRNERPFLEPEQIKVFISAVEGTDIEIAALLALSSLRRSEILAITWENIDLNKRIIKIRGSAVFDENQKLIHKKTNKNSSSARTIPIMMDELYRALQREQKKDGLIVKMHPNTIGEKINRVCKKCGLPEVGVHGLRHSFASLAYHLGMPEKVTMELGGWSDSQTMRKIYTHVAESDREKYADKMTSFFKKC